MQIVEPKVEYWEQKDPILHVAHCAQVCYQSKPKEKEAAEKFYKALISSNHVSMLRHESRYFKVPCARWDIYDYFEFSSSPYIDLKETDDWVYVATNANYILDHKEYLRTHNCCLLLWEVTPEEFKKECPELMRYTMCLTTQISTSRELNRVSPNNIAEMSTRYIKFGGKVSPAIVRPHWSSKGETLGPYEMYCQTAFEHYDSLLNQGMKPEDARGVLPLDTMTKVIYTYSVAEWSHILGMRLLDTTGKAHGNCHVICQLVYDELQKLGYKFNESNQLVYGDK